MLLDLRPDVVIADFFVICNGTGDRQLKALTDHVREKVKEKYGLLPHAVEGTPDSGWMLMDYGHIVLHVFVEERRTYYNLEGLWRTDGKVVLTIQ